MPHIHARSRRAFTLVELLIAMTLTIFIMSLFTTLFVTATSSVSSMRGISAVDQNVRTAVTTIRRDLEDVYLQLNVSAGNTPASAFKAPAVNSLPVGGYFLYEENSPALRQGVDEWGQPVEADMDDVLQFTVGRKGTSSSEMYYGRVFRDRNNVNNAVGVDLDNSFSPYARYDQPNNGLTSSTLAEVSYFLRPEGKQHTANDVRGHDGVTALTATVQTPATFTLYRKQLVILDESFASLMNSKSVPVTDYYRRFEVSAKPSQANASIMDFNTISNIDERWRRFGLNHHLTNDYPYSWSAQGSGSFNTAVVFNITTLTNPQWLGRPISVETNTTVSSSNISTQLQNKFSANNADPDLTGIIGDKTGTGVFDTVDAAYTNKQTINYTFGEDVLLRNVISFDVKVLDDDPRVEPDPPDPDGAGGMADPGAISTTAANGAQTVAVNPLRTTSVTADHRLPEFIDLGYRGVQGNAVGTLDTYYSLPSSNPSAAGNYYSYAYRSGTLSEPGFPERWRHRGRNYTNGGSVYVPLRTYDTWSDSYTIDPESATTTRRAIPYSKPLNALQIKIRVLEPRSGIVRETTIVHRFQ